MTEIHQLTEEQYSEFKAAFEFYDKDGDGQVSLKELGEVLKSLGQIPTEQELIDLVKEFDEKCESLDFTEFLAVMSKRLKDSDTEEELLEAFRVFDKERVGNVSIAELRYEMTKLNEKLSDEEIDEMIKEIDLYGDGTIKYEEWVKMAMSK